MIAENSFEHSTQGTFFSHPYIASKVSAISSHMAPFPTLGTKKGRFSNHWKLFDHFFQPLETRKLEHFTFFLCFPDGGVRAPEEGSKEDPSGGGTPSCRCEREEPGPPPLYLKGSVLEAFIKQPTANKERPTANEKKSMWQKAFEN